MSDDNKIIFPGSGNSQMQAIYADLYRQLTDKLSDQPETLELITKFQSAGMQIITHLYNALDVISEMQVTTYRQRNDLIEELNQIDKDLIQGTSHHPLVQKYMDTVTDKAQANAMSKLISNVASALDVEQFDADYMLLTLADQNPELYLSDEAKQSIINIFIDATQSAKASA